MRKLTSALAFVLAVSMVLLSGCVQSDYTNGPTTTPNATTAPNSTASKPSTAVTVPTTAPTEPEQTEPTTAPTEPEQTEPTEPVETEPQQTEPAPTEPSVPAELPETTVYIVGDSTVCGFSDKYYYPRYGYGTQLGNYLSEKVTIQNLALSGRSSKSFIVEDNYQTLKNSIKAGDYLLIGFGHNDEKSDDAARFTDASKDYTDPTSFGYYLFEYYIKLALDAGATPILCTPIVRASTDNDYTGSEGHITANGDYRQAIIDLANSLGISVVDLTTITKEQYASIGYDEASKYHATVAGQYADDGVTVIANAATVDKTHLNIYGAKYVAYRLACELQNIPVISGYVMENLTAPTDADLIPNPDYVVTDYAAPDLDNYSPAAQFKTMTSGWYGTAFGDTGGNPQSEGNGFRARETAEGVFEVGQSAGSNKGKFSSSSDGFAFVFRQVDANKNFTMSVTATIISAPSSVNQAGFGLMLRDDVYLNETATNASITSNYITAGVLGGSSATTVLFSRENTKLTKGEAFCNSTFVAGDSFTMTIERVGQSVTATVVYNGETYTTTYYDFDLFAKDTDYMYVGMFANRGTVVEFTDVVFNITGDSMGA